MIQYILPPLRLIIFSFLFFTTTLAFGMAQNTQIDTIKVEYEKIYEERQSYATELTRLEAEYLEIVRKVDHAKKTLRSITGRLELENLLRKSEGISTRLSQLQRKLVQIDTQLDGRRVVIIRYIQSEMRTLEKSLPKVAKTERKNIVMLLNALRETKVSFSAPLPNIPSPANVNLALRDADSLGDNPDELMAVADELQDAEDQLAKRLKAIQKQIIDLRNTQKLMKRAQRFSNEDQFFEESDRARIIAKYNTKETSDSNTPKVNDSNTGRSHSDNDLNEPNEGVRAPVNTEVDNANNNKIYSGDGNTKESGDDIPPTENVEIENTNTIEHIKIHGGGDPSRSISSSGIRAKNKIGRKINSLESEKKKLRKRMKLLQKRSQKLRLRAKNL